MLFNVNTVKMEKCKTYTFVVILAVCLCSLVLLYTWRTFMPSTPLDTLSSGSINSKQTEQPIRQNLSESDYLKSNCAGQLVPGLDRLALGVDVTQLDLYHDYTKDVQDGFKTRVLNWRCDQGNTWTSPYDGATYLVPDELDSVEALSSGLLVSDALIIQKLADMRQSMSQEVGLDISKLGKILGGFSASLTYKTSQELIEQHNSSMAENKAQINCHMVTLQPAFILAVNTTKTLSNSINVFLDSLLPDKLTNESAAAYAGFFKQFGTHYFAQADFGGSLSTWITIQSDLFKEMDSQSVSQSVKATFLGILKAHGAWTSDTGTVDSRFVSKTSHTERYYGGQADILDTDGFKTWWPTVAHNPWLHSGQVQPITDLLPDSHPKKQPLKDAYQVYLTKAYLNEVLRSVQVALKKPQSLGDRFLKVLEAQLTDAIASPLPSLDQANDWHEQFMRYTVVPEWFKNDVQVCTSFRNYGEVCSPVGVPTPGLNPFNPPLNHCPCEGSKWEPNCATEGQMYFKTATQEAKQMLDGYDGKFEITAQKAWIDIDYHQPYTARFVVNTSSESITPPGWLRNVRVCGHQNSFEGVKEQWICAAGPNDWVVPSVEARLINDPSFWHSRVNRGQAFSFYAVY